MTDAKEEGLIKKEEEEEELMLVPAENLKIKPIKKKTERSEKQAEASTKAGERLKKINEMKRAEKERIKKEEEAKIIADLKQKWTKEYEAEKNDETKIPKGMVAMPKSIVKKATERPRKVKVFKPVKKQIQANSDDETEEDDSDDDHVPQTDCESTDTRTIKKKLAKVKQIEQVVSKQAVNPYLSLLEKYYK
jgi:hypothetical protein